MLKWAIMYGQNPERQAYNVFHLKFQTLGLFQKNLKLWLLMLHCEVSSDSDWYIFV
jgi:hypothetical protein